MKEQILALFAEVLPQIDFTASDKMVDDGILDSMSIMTMLAELSVEFGIQMNINDLEPSDLNSIDAIVQTVENMLKNK